ncbi:MAG: hypothetical protein R3B09_01885 [Nannocystaceae bacterium]
MLSSSRRLLVVLSTALLACSGGDDGGTSVGTQGSVGSTSEATTTGGTDDTSSSSESASASATGVDDGCMSHAAGEWNACKDGLLTMNSNCKWEAGEGSGEVSCLQPSSGGGNVCSVAGCVDVCDCFTPPATGNAVVVCAPVLADSNACVLNCAGGQTCPDGMGCKAGYCYWITE